MSNINAEEIRALRVPLPKLPKQEELLGALDTAREQRKEMLARADDLLSGLDSFVLDQLDLTLPPLDGRMVYAAHLRDVRSRLDADYHSPRFRTLRHKIDHGGYGPRTIQSLCDFMQSGFAAGGDDQTDDPSVGIPHIRPLNITSTGELHFDGTKMVPRSAVEPGDYLRPGEVLFNNTNSTAWVGKSVVFDANRECVCSNHITRLRLAAKGDDDPYFLAAVLNALRGLGYFGLLSTNFNNQAGINVDSLGAVRIPWPEAEIRSKIATEVARRREVARGLRQEADALWEQAKAEFEAVLLGPPMASSAPMRGGH
jgi:type I restriction enzyme S subunit